MRSIILALAIGFALALSGAQASHCTTWSTSITSEEMIVVELAVSFDVRYVVNDLCQDDPYEANDPNDPYDDTGPCLFSIWLYYETNGIEGLQRGDEVVDDTCHWMIESDVFVW